MSSQNKAATALMGATIVLLIVLGIGFGWPVWATALIVLGGCGVVIAGIVVGRGERTEPPLPVVYAPPSPAPEPPSQVQMVVVQGINLASAWADYEFVFDVTVYWRPADNAPASPHVRPGAVAVDMIIRRAAEVAAHAAPGMAVRLQHRLNDILGVVKGDPAGRILAWADQVRTTLSDKDLERLRSLADIRKDKAVWEHQRNYESDRRQYLTEDVLKSTGSAIVWWLSRNESNVHGAVDLIGTMARLSAAAKNEDVDALFRHLVPSSMLPDAEPSLYPAVGSDGASLGFGSMNGTRSATDFVTGLMDTMRLDADERALFAERVAMDMAAMGHEEAAQQIRDEFDVITEEFIDDAEPVSATDPEENSTPEESRFTPED
jgi:hypothetical protein